MTILNTPPRPGGGRLWRLPSRFAPRPLHGDIHLTSAFVTHDQDEALELADRVAVMNHGRIEQQGTADDVVDRLATRFVAEFLTPEPIAGFRTRRRRPEPVVSLTAAVDHRGLTAVPSIRDSRCLHRAE